MDRRLFLRYLQDAALGLALLDLATPLRALAAPPAEPWLAGVRMDAAYRDPTVDDVAKSPPSMALLWSPARPETSKVPIPFYGHSLCQHPLRLAHFATFEKWGRRGAIVDFKSGKVEVILTAPEGRRFFGHGVYSPDGARLFVSAMNDERGESAILVYETGKYTLAREFPTGGYHAHDLQCLEENPGHLIVAHTGHHEAKTPRKDNKLDYGSKLSILDSETGKVLRAIPTALQPKDRVSHFVQSDGWLIASDKTEEGVSDGAPKRAYAVVIPPNGKARVLEVPAAQRSAYLGELLSLAVAKDTVFITSPVANAVFAWNYKEARFERRIEAAGPSGIAAIDGKLYLAQTGGEQRARLLLRSVAAEETKPESFVPELFTGAHLTLAKKPF